MNSSGIEPLDVRVLVKPDPVEEVTKGGIILSASIVEKDKYATVKATLSAVGVNAWAEASRSPMFIAPQAGDRVMIAKYGGVMIVGADGVDYRIMNDEDVIAVLTGEA
jgi:chaperonin GroES